MSPAATAATTTNKPQQQQQHQQQHKPPPPPPPTFTITAPPATDIWRTPPSTRLFNAPLAHTSRGPLSSFSRAGLSLALPQPRGLVLYDQGGIVLAITRAGTGSDGGDEQRLNGGGGGDVDGDGPPARWLKAGIEIFEGEPWLSVVGCDRWSDVSMAPLSWGGGGGKEANERRPTARVEVERVGESLRVYWVVAAAAAADGRGEEKRMFIREVNWFFAQEGGEEGWEVSVAAYAARPLKNEKDEDEVLEVDFERFEVEWA